MPADGLYRPRHQPRPITRLLTTGDRHVLVAANLLLLGLAVAGRPGLALSIALAVPVALAVVRRPQRGVLLLFALVPFDGLRTLVAHPRLLDGWKEVLVVATLGATFIAPPSARAQHHRRPPSWFAAVVGLFAVAASSAILSGGTAASYGMKIMFFYLLLAAAIWRCPLDAQERDRVVTILFGTGLVCAVYGLLQQAIGGAGLNELGYQYNDTIRFAGGLLRSFSTFVQPFGFGFYEMVVILVCLPVALSQPGRRRSNVMLALMPVLVLGLLSSVVRASWLGLAVGVIYLGVRHHRKLLLLLPLVVVALVLLLSAGGACRGVLSGESGAERTTGWSERGREVLSHPLGVGIGSTGAAAEKAQRLGGVDDPDYYTPDNQYFLTLNELGVLGLWWFLLLVAAVAIDLRRSERRLAGPDAALARGVTAMVVAAAAASLMASYLQIFPMDVLWWALITIVATMDGGEQAPDETASLPATASA